MDKQEQMEMKAIIVEGSPKEIAALVLELQELQTCNLTDDALKQLLAKSVERLSSVLDCSIRSTSEIPSLVDAIRILHELMGKKSSQEGESKKYRCLD